MRRPNDEEWTHLVEDGDVEGREEWMDGVSAVFNYFAERTPGSYIEKQAMAVVGTGRLLRMVFCCFFSYLFRWVWSLVNVNRLRDQSPNGGGWIQHDSAFQAPRHQILKCFCWGWVLHERFDKICLEEYMYRWSWDNAQFDFGSAQAREVLQLGLTFGG